MKLPVYYFIIYVAEAFIWLKYASTVFQRKRTVHFCFLTLSFLYLVLFLISGIHIIWINAAFFLFGNFIFTMLSYYAPWPVAFFHAAIATAIMSLCELTTSHFFFPYPDNEPAFLMLIIWAIFSKASYFVILFLLSQIFKQKQCNDKPYDIAVFLLIGIPVISLIISLILFSTSISFPLDSTHKWMISVGSILLLFMNLLIFYLYHHNQKQSSAFTKMQLIMEKEYNASTYYQMLLEQKENQSILIHDIKKHLLTIALLNKEQNYEKTDSYIQNLTRSSALQNPVRVCDNELLNMILSQYQKQCSGKSILLYLDIRSSVTDFLEDNDLTSLFCNLLDNAVEAAEKVSDGFIELNIDKQPPSLFTVITMTNSCLVSPFSDKGYKLITKKKDTTKHGFGMISVKKTVEKYHGNLQTWYGAESASFHTVIALKSAPQPHISS